MPPFNTAEKEGTKAVEPAETVNVEPAKTVETMDVETIDIQTDVSEYDRVLSLICSLLKPQLIKYGPTGKDIIYLFS